MFLVKQDEKINMKLTDNKADIIKEISDYRNGTRVEFDSKIRTIEGYTQMIHH